MLKNRIFATLIAVALSAVLLTSCGAPAPAPSPTAAPAQPGTTTQATSAPAAAAAQFLTLNVEQQSTWVRNFNPFSPDARLQATQGGIYEPMMIFNKSTGELLPWLAVDYKWNADNTELTFHLRPNVLWSDGQPFTAKDVLFTFDLIKNNQALLNNIGSILTDNIETWSAPDDQTVVFQFKTVHTPALHLLADQLIVPEHIWKDVKDPVTFTNENPVGTGPFTEVTKFQDQIYVLEKNPHYWQQGKPYVQGLRFPAYPGNDEANLALANGELDWAGNFVPDIEKTFVAKNPADFHYYFVGGDGVLLYVNTNLKPFDDPDVRKAISMGIDRKMVVDVAEYNYIPPSDATGLSEEYKQWKNAEAVAAGTWTNYDVKAANDLLDKAGLKKGEDGIRVGPDGKPMKYAILSPNGWTDWNSACQIIAQNMKDLGIELTLDTPEQNTWQEEVFQGNFQWTLGWSSGGATPYEYYRGQMSSMTVVPIGTDANENWNRYVDPEADKLLNEFAQTSDPAKQKDLMNQLQVIFVNDAPALPLFPGPDWYEYVTTRFTDFPTQDNPYAPGPPYSTPTFAANPLLVLTSVKPK
ncbi:MAG TPA: ABC transporter substrate-binding protein [Anaerolineales bacterium]|nr:ABC transporter substrate-binding protein [Anaerolineales bacterium]